MLPVVWMSEIIHIHVRMGLFTATILASYPHKVAGKAVSSTLDLALMLKALRMAIARVKLRLINSHHGGQRVHYVLEESIGELNYNASRLERSGSVILKITPRCRSSLKP